MKAIRMLKCIFILLMFVPFFAFGQQTIEVNDKNNCEVYHVLKADKLVKHGHYLKLYANGLTFMNGFFKSGIKDSVWEFYDCTGELEQKFNFTQNKLLFYKISDNSEKKFEVMDGSDTIKKKLDRPPLYIGGDVLMYETLCRDIRYPEMAMEVGISGKVIVSFIIVKDGKAKDFMVFKSLGFGCDEEALRVVKAISNNWLPGIFHGKTVDVKFLLQIEFILAKED